jgi:hypothetical protein
VLDVRSSALSSTSSVAANVLEKSTVFEVDWRHRHELEGLSAYNSFRYRSPKVSTAKYTMARTTLLDKDLPSVLKRQSVLTSLSKDPVFLRFCERVDSATYKRIQSAPRNSRYARRRSKNEES